MQEEVCLGVKILVYFLPSPVWLMTSLADYYLGAYFHKTATTSVCLPQRKGNEEPEDWQVTENLFLWGMVVEAFGFGIRQTWIPVLDSPSWLCSPRTTTPPSPPPEAV